MRINALPLYNKDYTIQARQYNAPKNYLNNRQSNKKQPNFTGHKIPESISREAGVIGAIACLVGIPFLMCLAIKNLFGLKDKNTNEHIFLNDGSYFAHVDDFK